MRKSIIAIFFALLGILFSAHGISVCAGNDYLIVPGRSAGEITIGKPVPQKVLDSLGKSTTYTPPVKGRDGMDTGNYYWEGLLNVKLNDGNADMNVFQIILMSPRYQTNKKIKVGSTWAQVKKAYPGGKKVESMDVDFGWELPGIVFQIAGSKVCSISVFPVK